jgi:diacylglycerol kinase
MYKYRYTYRYRYFKYIQYEASPGSSTPFTKWWLRSTLSFSGVIGARWENLFFSQPVLYVLINLCKCILIHLCKSEYIYISISICIYTYIYVYIYMSFSGVIGAHWENRFFSQPVLYVLINLCKCILIHLCTSEYVYISISIYIYIYIYTYIYMYIYMSFQGS